MLVLEHVCIWRRRAQLILARGAPPLPDTNLLYDLLLTLFSLVEPRRTYRVTVGDFRITAQNEAVVGFGNSQFEGHFQ